MDVLPAIKIATRSGSRLVEAEAVVGPFAAHRSETLAGLTLTHIPTGRAVTHCLRHLGTAVALAKALDKAADWNFTDGSKPPEGWTKYRREKVRGLIRAYERDDKLGRFAETNRRTPDGGA